VVDRHAAFLQQRYTTPVAPGLRHGPAHPGTPEVRRHL